MLFSIITVLLIVDLLIVSGVAAVQPSQTHLDLVRQACLASVAAWQALPRICHQHQNTADVMDIASSIYTAHRCISTIAERGYFLPNVTALAHFQVGQQWLAIIEEIRVACETIVTAGRASVNQVTVAHIAAEIPDPTQVNLAVQTALSLADISREAVSRIEVAKERAHAIGNVWVAHEIGYAFEQAQQG